MHSGKLCHVVTTIHGNLNKSGKDLKTCRCLCCFVQLTGLCYALHHHVCLCITQSAAEKSGVCVCVCVCPLHSRQEERDLTTPEQWELQCRWQDHKASDKPGSALLLTLVLCLLKLTGLQQRCVCHHTHMSRQVWLADFVIDPGGCLQTGGLLAGWVAERSRAL